MGRIDELRNYIIESNFKMTLIDNNIDILNYNSIEHFDSSKVIVKYEKGTIVISGKNLVVSKLLDDEILINGLINNIELR